MFVGGVDVLAEGWDGSLGLGSRLGTRLCGFRLDGCPSMVWDGTWDGGGG